MSWFWVPKRCDFAKKKFIMYLEILSELLGATIPNSNKKEECVGV